MHKSHGMVIASLVALSSFGAWGACAVDPSLYQGERTFPREAGQAQPSQRVYQSGPASKWTPAVERLSPEQKRWKDMYYAVSRRDLRAFAHLLPADPGKRHDELAAHGWLATAARAAALDIVRQILAWHPDLAHPVNARAQFTPALVDLIQYWDQLSGPPVADRIEVLRYLLEWGANPDGHELGNPLIQIAAIHASDETARAANMLVQAGARNVEWRGSTPLRKAAELSNGSVAQAILRNPVSRAELDDALVRTPVRSTNAVLGLLLAHGADVNTPLALPGSGGTLQPFPAVFMAVEAFQDDGNLSVVEQVLKYGADPNRTRYGVTPVMAAVHDPAVLGLLLAAGADPDVRNAGGLNALMQTRNGDDASIRMLLDRGSRVRMEFVVWSEYSKPRTAIGPVSWSLIRGNDSLAAALVARQAPENADCGAPYYAAQAGATATLRALRQRRVDLTDIRDDRWLTPFMIAAKQGQLEAVRFFLDEGVARPDETVPRRPAIEGSGHPRIPMLTVRGGESVLDIARQARQDAVVQELMKRGAR